MSTDANDHWYCLQKIGPFGTSATLAIHFAPRAQRDRLLGIFALEREWESVVEAPNARDLAPVRFGWWQEEIERERAQSTHPVLRLLARSRAFDAMPKERLLQSLHAYLELSRGRDPAHDPVARTLLRDSRGMFLQWTALDHISEVPVTPVGYLAASHWFLEAFLKNRKPGFGTEALETAREELHRGLEASNPFLRTESGRTIRILSALTGQTLRAINRTTEGGRWNDARPALPVKLWQAWSAARDEQPR